ncbi:unnamed protein product [Blepharisma stoltei]|uniref:CCAAT-binding factor domain-containing protein n=1 Tax=Blepharisma stoltei TaxID=1481888 RepID=A0AAU9KGW6_9CILI|nr:unnamed protein product [Blepharisma stoltei]
MKEYQDIATESAKVISSLVKDEEFDLNIIYEFLSQIPSPSKLKENVFYPELAPPSLASKKRKRKENFDPELAGQRILVDSDSWAIRYKQSIGQIWKELTDLSLEAADIKFLLKALCKYGLPNVSDPLMFSDFYLKSFDNGGNTAVLALSGLFILMTKHGLEAKQYYMKLYQLIRTQLQKGKTLSKSFLKLLELSLSSPMLPSSLIGSFIKVLLKESLLSPVSTTLWAVAFTVKSFKIHSGLLPMINNNHKEDKFNYEELNPLYTKSIESSLWELMILKKHYHPKIRELVTEFEKPVEKMARVTTAEVMNLEVPQKRPKLNPKPFKGIFN